MRGRLRELLAVQRADGGWSDIPSLNRTAYATGKALVALKTAGFQPYFDAGFPYGHDQWISAAGTSWATMALTLDAPAPVTSLAGLRFR